ncbi:glycosyltransferase [Aeromonas salmonicida]|uniref:glycosyltransferase n=1 Tax=Aeromonas salmonicida TaxID=645 RepID=UPI0038BA5386
MGNMVTIMATYNGALYLKDAIASITNDSDLFISDDLSTDNTLSIVNEFNGERSLTLVTNFQGGSASRNFCHALNEVSDEYGYYFLSDQDDVWSENKSQLLYGEMLSLESLKGKDTPILIFGDSIVVDKELKVIADSFFEYDGINPEILSNPMNLFFQNIGQGATFIFNQALLKLIRPMPLNVYMHDWWLMLYACHFGVLHLSKHKTLYYRQHGNNQIGARERNIISQVASNIKGNGKVSKHIVLVRNQIDKFIEHTAKISYCNNNLAPFIHDYESISNKNFLKRKIFLFKYRVFLSNIKRTLALYLFF